MKELWERVTMKDAITSLFGKPRVFLPVIHLPKGGIIAERAVATAVTAGADGIFLINQGAGIDDILHRIIPALRHRYGRRLWIGVNLLGYDVSEIIRRFATLVDIDGIWSDDAGVDCMKENVYVQERDAYLKTRAETGWKGLYFGGTAFKTQRDIPVDQLPVVAKLAASFVDVVTSSGRGTGVAADIEKVHILRQAIPEAALALASGVTPENVKDYLPFVDAYLVATGIESAYGVLDPERTKALADKIHAWE
jgi:hypothetical protein